MISSPSGKHCFYLICVQSDVYRSIVRPLMSLVWVDDIYVTFINFCKQDKQTSRNKNSKTVAMFSGLYISQLRYLFGIFRVKWLCIGVWSKVNTQRFLCTFVRLGQASILPTWCCTLSKHFISKDDLPQNCGPIRL